MFQMSICDARNDVVRSSRLVFDPDCVIWETAPFAHEAHNTMASTSLHAWRVALKMSIIESDGHTTSFGISKKIHEQGLVFVKFNKFGLGQPPFFRVRTKAIGIEELDAAIWGSVQSNPVADSLGLRLKQNYNSPFSVERVFDVGILGQLRISNDFYSRQELIDIVVTQRMINSWWGGATSEATSDGSWSARAP